MGVHWICDHYVCTGLDLHKIGGKMDIWIVGATWFLIGLIVGSIATVIIKGYDDEWGNDYDDDEEDDDETN